MNVTVRHLIGCRELSKPPKRTERTLFPRFARHWHPYRQGVGGLLDTFREAWKGLGKTELSDKGVLLLTGMPVWERPTRHVDSGRIRDLGYSIPESGDIVEVERFLDDPTKAPRIAILDDPLSDSSTIRHPSGALDRIERLIRRLQIHRKLVVAQVESTLLDAARALTVSDVQTAGNSWHELNTFQTTFLLEVWQCAAVRRNVPHELNCFIRQAISSRSLKVEPGCLEHLRRITVRLEGKPALDRIADWRGNSLATLVGIGHRWSRRSSFGGRADDSWTG